MGLRDDIRCKNHPNMDATALCNQCGMPICPACTVKGETGTFCSEGCRDQNEAFEQRLADHDTRPKGKRFNRFFVKRLVMNLIAFGIVFLAGSLVAAYLKIPIPVFSTVGDWLIGLLPFLGE